MIQQYITGNCLKYRHKAFELETSREYRVDCHLFQPNGRTKKGLYHDVYDGRKFDSNTLFLTVDENIWPLKD